MDIFKDGFPIANLDFLWGITFEEAEKQLTNMPDLKPYGGGLNKRIICDSVITIPTLYETSQ